MSKHTLSVLVENKPGVLARIASLFSRRGFNIDSLAVGETEYPEISRMTVVVDVEDLPLEQVFRAKVVDVATESLTIEATGTSDKLRALLDVLEPYGVKELVQSGLVAIGRGPRSITDRALRVG
jgi:acetolactate synthase-1/3 small subunit